MSGNSVSDAKTPSLTEPLQPQPKPQPQTNQPSLGDHGLSVGQGGSRFVDSGPNSVISLGGIKAQTNYYPRFRKSKVSFLLPAEVNKGSTSSDKVESNDKGGEGEKKEELLGAEEEETNLMLKNLDNKKEEVEGRKIFNLRPRKEKKVVNSRTQVNAVRGRVTRQTCKLPEIPTRLRTQTRSRSASNATVFSLALSKKEIESDFLKMTGELPPKKPQRRARSLGTTDSYPSLFALLL
ncbi:unnamed protein product [Lupinus luteus]|uniref:Uncharacterized protein n=1 Tax=Lupinus luteus TaxID=3873 RepID=A0AAV1Y6T5_LUPLU